MIIYRCLSLSYFLHSMGCAVPAKQASVMVTRAHDDSVSTVNLLLAPLLTTTARFIGPDRSSLAKNHSQLSS